MLKKNLLFRSIFVAGLTTGLAACGGGSSSSSGSPSGGGSPSGDASSQDPVPQTETGRFVDSAVAGLEYSSEPSGLSGLTDGNGEFKYHKGDRITFSVGNFRIGEADGTGLITPVEIANNDSAKTANIARFLQTLDEDGIADNGISISGSSRVKAALAIASDVADINLDNAKTANSILALTEENPVPSTEIVAEEEAVAHLTNTLQTEKPVNQCGTETETLSSERIVGKTFGFIRSDEVAVFQFDATNVTEIHQDDANNGELTDRETAAWSVDGASMTIFGETFTACATDAYLIFETPDGPVKMYELDPYTLPAEGKSQSYMLSFSNVDQALLTVDSAGELDYFPTESPLSANSKATAVDGVLKLNFDEGVDAIDSIFFLKAQGKRKGIYVDYGESGALQQVGTATIVPTATAATNDTIAGQTLLWRNDEANEIVIFSYSTDGSYIDYNNDFYQNGEQTAKRVTGEWSFTDGVLTQIDHETMNFNLLETATSVYFAEQGVESFGGLNETVFESPREVSKAKQINAAAFVGNYTVNMPTENTVSNTLIVDEGGTCTYSGTACDWSVATGDMVEIRFDEYPTTIARAWQFANRSEAYAFLITHEENPEDIEPGFMTRQ